MRHIVAIIVAFVGVGVVLAITVGAMAGATMGEILLATTLIVAIAYPIGDLVVLPATNNFTGIAVDAAVAALVMWLMIPVARGGVLLLSLLGLGVVLYFFHLYLYATILDNRTVTT